MIIYFRRDQIFSSINFKYRIKNLRINLLISKECDIEDRFFMYRTSTVLVQFFSILDLIILENYRNCMRAFRKLYLFFISELSYVVYIIIE